MARPISRTSLLQKSLFAKRELTTLGIGGFGFPMQEPYQIRVERFTTQHLFAATSIVAFLVAVGYGRMGTIPQTLLAATGIGIGGGTPFALVALRLLRAQPNFGPARTTKWQYTIPTAFVTAVAFWIAAAADIVKTPVIWDIAVLLKIVLIIFAMTAAGHAFEAMAGSGRKAAITFMIWIGASAAGVGLLLALRPPLLADIYDQNFFPMLPRPENVDSWPAYSTSLQRQYDTFEIPFTEFGIATTLALINTIIGYAFGKNRRRACAVALPISIAFMLGALTFEIEYGIAHVQIVTEVGWMLRVDRTSLPVMATCFGFVIASSELAAGWNQSRSKQDVQLSRLKG